MHGLRVVWGLAWRIFCRRSKRAPISALGCSSKGELLGTATAPRQDSAKTSRNYRLPGQSAYFLAASPDPLHPAGIRALHLPRFSQLLAVFAPRTNSPGSVRTADSPRAEFLASIDAPLPQPLSRISARPLLPRCAAARPCSRGFALASAASFCSAV